MEGLSTANKKSVIKVIDMLRKAQLKLEESLTQLEGKPFTMMPILVKDPVEHQIWAGIANAFRIEMMVSMQDQVIPNLARKMVNEGTEPIHPEDCGGDCENCEQAKRIEEEIKKEGGADFLKFLKGKKP